MKKYFIILLTFLYFSIPGIPDSPDGDSPVTGFLDITVESNVNKVLFSYPISDRNLRSGNSRLTNIVLPVRDFECNNKIAFRDFLTLLKADKYPEMVISLPWNVFRQLEYDDDVTLKNISITIAGVSKKYDIYCTAENQRNGDRILSGTIMVNLNDLDIVPPTKYFGMVKIKDEVIVKFGLGLTGRNYVRK